MNAYFSTNKAAHLSTPGETYCQDDPDIVEIYVTEGGAHSTNIPGEDLAWNHIDVDTLSDEAKLLLSDHYADGDDAPDGWLLIGWREDAREDAGVSVYRRID